MNKRQQKKKVFKVVDRMNQVGKIFNNYEIGRRNGKTYLINRIFHMCYMKKYRPFNEELKGIKEWRRKAIDQRRTKQSI